MYVSYKTNMQINLTIKVITLPRETVQVLHTRILAKPVPLIFRVPPLNPSKFQKLGFCLRRRRRPRLLRCVYVKCSRSRRATDATLVAWDLTGKNYQIIKNKMPTMTKNVNLPFSFRTWSCKHKYEVSEYLICLVSREKTADVKTR